MPYKAQCSVVIALFQTSQKIFLELQDGSRH